MRRWGARRPRPEPWQRLTWRSSPACSLPCREGIARATQASVGHTGSGRAPPAVRALATTHQRRTSPSCSLSCREGTARATQASVGHTGSRGATCGGGAHAARGPSLGDDSPGFHLLHTCLPSLDALHRCVTDNDVCEDGVFHVTVIKVATAEITFESESAQVTAGERVVGL